MHRSEQDSAQKADILDLLQRADEQTAPSASHGDLLTQCRQLLAQDDANNTLHLINKFLKKEPDHYEATQIKISALEKSRRHVEAAELKHDLKKLEPIAPPRKTEELANKNDQVHEPNLTEQENEEKEIVYSVVIPTTGVGKSQMEQCLNSLAGAVSKSDTELIVIDNASIDDTFDYLDQLTEKEFLNIRVITNSSNAGFAASVNLGLDAARGEFVLVLHNDVEVNSDIVSELEKGFDG